MGDALGKSAGPRRSDALTRTQRFGILHRIATLTENGGIVSHPEYSARRIAILLAVVAEFHHIDLAVDLHDRIARIPDTPASVRLCSTGQEPSSSGEAANCGRTPRRPFCF